MRSHFLFDTTIVTLALIVWLKNNSLATSFMLYYNVSFLLSDLKNLYKFLFLSFRRVWQNIPQYFVISYNIQWFMYIHTDKYYQKELSPTS